MDACNNPACATDNRIKQQCEQMSAPSGTPSQPTVPTKPTVKPTVPTKPTVKPEVAAAAAAAAEKAVSLASEKTAALAKAALAKAALAEVGSSEWNTTKAQAVLGAQSNLVNQGFCTTNSDDPNLVASCAVPNTKGTLNPKKKCEAKGDDCSWVPCGIDSPNWVNLTTNFKGLFHDELLTCIGGSRVINDSTIKWNDPNITISTGHGGGDKVTSAKDPTKWNTKESNFLKYIGCKLSTGHTPKYTCKGSIIKSKGIRSKIEDIADSCYDGWDNKELKGVYAKNGGTPIMSLTKNEGLVCRNPFYKTETIKTSDPHLVADKDNCPVGSCPCRTDTNVTYKHKGSFVDDHIVRLWDDWTGPRCQFGTYKSDNHWFWCAPHHGSDLVGGTFRKNVSKLASSRQGTCK